MKAAIKREESDARISYPEREQARCETSRMIIMIMKNEDEVVRDLIDRRNERDFRRIISKIKDRKDRGRVCRLLREVTCSLEKVYSLPILHREIFFEGYFQLYSYLRSHKCFERMSNGFQEEEKKFLREVLEVED